MKLTELAAVGVQLRHSLASKMARRPRRRTSCRRYTADPCISSLASRSQASSIERVIKARVGEIVPVAHRRLVSDAPDAQADCALGDPGGDGADRKIALAPRHFTKGVTGALLPPREPDRHHHLVGLARGLQQAELEIRGGDFPRGGLGAQDHRSAERGEAQRQLGAGVAVGDAAADGAAAARLKMADVGKGLREQRGGGCQFRPGQQSRLRGGGADLDVIGFQAHGVEFLEVGDIEQHLGLDQAEIHLGHERQPACDDPRVLAVALEAVECLGKAARTDVFESAWFHYEIPRSFSRRCHQDDGVSAGAAPGAPVSAASLWKNWFTTTRAVPSSMRPPMAATLPLMSNP